jgi:hypothetical protein
VERRETAEKTRVGARKRILRIPSSLWIASGIWNWGFGGLCIDGKLMLDGDVVRLDDLW